jgi:uncharacterized protein YidB (DUF937 family)
MSEKQSLGLDDLLGGLTGGGGGGAGGLDDLLGGLLGGSGGGAGGLGDVLGGLTGGGSPGATTGSQGGAGGLLAALLPMLGSLLASGGLNKILNGFRQQGLSSEADSWVGTGANDQVSGEQVREVIDDAEIAQIAQQLGVSEDEAATAIAAVLPTLVDRVSPDGQLLDEQSLDNAFSQLASLGSR